ncbi:MAG: DUF4433 domain-containing protein [Symploca sp. SIO2C1]|nr:DUF4433 domain-containing protein [Symploca sp. SIO2C1]
MSRKVGIEGLYYITHIDNIPSILKRGILSHSEIEKEEIQPATIYSSEIVNKRRKRIVSGETTLWDFANLYFQPRNAMLYSLVCNPDVALDDLAIICLKRRILDREDIFLTTGNAASSQSEILSKSKASLGNIRNQIGRDWWNKEDGSKRKIMAECLVPKKVDPADIQTVYVATGRARPKVVDLIDKSWNSSSSKPPVAAEPKIFFQPDWKARIADKIAIVKGDMFFSRMQTLTVSVNCVGAMGKGLASTAKRRFPDVYVRYQDLCKKKQIMPGKPCLYKRESSVFDELYDDDYLPLEAIEDNFPTWFLLFPTKNHWRNKSNIHDIERGLKWLVDNHQAQGIQSLALPALGCGLGGLDWYRVGPLMCKYLVLMKDIQVVIYLPTEREIPGEYLTPEFLLSQVDF